MIGFQGEVPARAFGGINVPAAPAALISCPQGGFTLCFCVRESGLVGLLLVRLGVRGEKHLL